jgi:hypothetical protein
MYHSAYQSRIGQEDLEPALVGEDDPELVKVGTLND